MPPLGSSMEKRMDRIENKVDEMQKALYSMPNEITERVMGMLQKHFEEQSKIDALQQAEIETLKSDKVGQKDLANVRNLLIVIISIITAALAIYDRLHG